MVLWLHDLRLPLGCQDQRVAGSRIELKVMKGPGLGGTLDENVCGLLSSKHVCEWRPIDDWMVSMSLGTWNKPK